MKPNNDVKVMIVEDDPMVSFLHKALVVKRNICAAPESFMNGVEALDFILSDPSEDSFYLILLDINMPLMNGWEFLDELQDLEVASRTSVVIVTSSPDKKDRDLAKNYGNIVSAYLEKPLIDFSPIQNCMKELEKRDIES